MKKISQIISSVNIISELCISKSFKVQSACQLIFVHLDVFQRKNKPVVYKIEV